MRRSVPLLVVGALALGACSDHVAGPDAAPDERAPAPLASKSSAAAFTADGPGHVVLGRAGVGVEALAAAVEAAGGTVTGSLHDLDIVLADLDDNAARELARANGVEDVARDLVFAWAPEEPAAFALDDASEPIEAGHGMAASEPFAFLQWAVDAVHAPEAWAAGYTGAGVRVAILDGGLYDQHPDLAPNIDAAASASFTTGAWNEDLGTFWHGTHVAGIVGAARNGVGTVGIAPEATLVGVKVLHGGSGPFSGIIAGMYYAATPLSMGGAGAHVLNMSLGVRGGIPTKGAFKKDIAALLKAIDRASVYARQHGAVVVAAMGNDAIDFGANDHRAPVPADNQHVVGVSSTAPTGWALGGTDYTTPASYSSYGLNDVDLSAPGGNFDYPGSEICFFGFPCWVFDGYLSSVRGSGPPGSGTWSWAQGTSMASPVVAGVAALVIEAEGGSAPPSLVENRMAQGAMGMGNSAFYGKGWVSAAGAVGAH